ncbi:alpha/beta hydrolase [Phanerochaete sordida]|uniref:Alpha/beta hydrolase n=1 Tax=Phanerochaete sordida TaxID=48140 RepID=A0A9P3LKL1_9APHY|nr:alpha/beta hydrolase [Phanerochaete sordida]
MSPSKFSAGNSCYLGPILFNPGGPGESGVDYLLAYEPYFRAIIGPQYDLVGFDPRGVGATTPFLSLFNSPAEALEFYSTLPFNVNDSVSALGRLYAQTKILGELALDRARTVAESVGTAAVATDMLQIARAFGQDNVNYWGISYGSVLGATFAAMFPQNVGRFIIDGVSDSHEWYYSAQDTSSLLETDAALTSVYDACVAAGPSKCALWANTTGAIRTRVDSDLTTLHQAPVPIYNSTDPRAITFAVADYPLAFWQLFLTTYYPYNTGAGAAAAFAALERGDGAPIYAGSIASSIAALDTCAAAGAPFVAGLLDVTSPIFCGDSLVEKRRTLAEAKEDYEAMSKISPFAASWYATFVGPCATWPIKAKDRFNGSFETNTSTPLLLISNTLDPVTPIQSGRKMSQGFHGSVLLQQNSTGHSSLSGFSTCTALAIRAYFQAGALPAAGTVCQPDTAIFDAPNNSSGFGGVTLGARAADALGLGEARRVQREATFLHRRASGFPL